MVVKFPSSPEDDAGDGTPRDEVGEQERLAPVTPLRRAAAARPEGSDDHPSRRGTARPVVGLNSSAGGRNNTAARNNTGGWNNTWGTEAPASVAAAAEEPDEETIRQTRKTSGLAIRQLARRGMSRWELEQVLNKREIEPEVYGPELDRLEALGVIDDASLAVTLAFTQHSRKGLGRSAIAQELKSRHIAPEFIEAALADIGEDDELERATELAVKRMGQLSSYDDETARRRLHGFLARKGYASDVVRQAMDAAFAGRRSRGGSGVRFQ
ncbi:regulatory protein RecX [Leifsonia sp. fls2-241-R2A-40a]|uniref:regulatory protein RecX n=1 Tax=Leifsonia sp. fls2-241-R2A-40a TaxID=3040290 RepID=UPI00254C954A|nr:regulatory protein RecX [Leifsonia sp. fls2-241-R2A-40a]